MAAGTLLVALLGAGQTSAAGEPDSAEAASRWQSARQRPVALRRPYGVSPAARDVGDASFTDSGRKLRWKQSSEPHVRWTSPSPARTGTADYSTERPAADRDPRSAKEELPAPRKTVLRLEASDRTSSGPRLAQLEDPLLLDEESVMQAPSQGLPDAGGPFEDTLPMPEGLDTDSLTDEPLPEPFSEDTRSAPIIGRDQESAAHVTPEEECSRGLEAITESVIGNIDLNIAVMGDPGDELPYECTLEGGTFAQRLWAETLYTWKASSLCHKPLYFEELALERYGHSKGPYVQPLYSAAHFFASLPALPYLMGLRPPKECVYALGHYRPGSCAPYLKYPIPISTRGALFEAGAVVGAAAVLP